MKRLIMFLSLSLLAGCGTAPTTVATRTEGVIVQSVDTTMKGWRDWVTSGHGTQSQVDAVHSAYDKYYAAQLVAKASLEKWVASKNPADLDGYTTAQASVTATENAIINMVNSFLK